MEPCENSICDAKGVVVPVEHDRPETEDLTPERTFRRSVGEGRRRLGRGMLYMASTGLVGGIDVGTGVLGLLLVECSTGSKLLGGLAFCLEKPGLPTAPSVGDNGRDEPRHDTSDFPGAPSGGC